MTHLMVTYSGKESNSITFIFTALCDSFGCSPLFFVYFRALFSYDGNLAKHEGKSCINLSVNLETFHSILDYIYTAEISLTTENIQDILQVNITTEIKKRHFTDENIQDIIFIGKTYCRKYKYKTVGLPQI